MHVCVHMNACTARMLVLRPKNGVCVLDMCQVCVCVSHTNTIVPSQDQFIFHC